MKNNGFSLIELIVVIAIIAILAAIAVPSYTTYKYKAQVSKATVVLNDIADQMIKAYVNGSWNCHTSTTFIYNGTTYPVDVTDYTLIGDSIASVAINKQYSPFLCDNVHVGAIGIFVNGLDGLTATINNNLESYVQNTSSGNGNLSELRCEIIDNNGVIQKVCGIYDPTYPWQVPANLLPAGYDCILGTNQHYASGMQCSSAL